MDKVMLCGTTFLRRYFSPILANSLMVTNDDWQTTIPD
jgi:hypothetical protein